MVSLETDPACESAYPLTRLRFAENASEDPPTVVFPSVSGAAVTTAVGDDDAGAEAPPAFDAVTAATSVEPASAPCTAYVDPEAPEMPTQLAPPESHRDH